MAAIDRFDVRVRTGRFYRDDQPEIVFLKIIVNSYSAVALRGCRCSSYTAQGVYVPLLLQKFLSRGDAFENERKTKRCHFIT